MSFSSSAGGVQSAQLPEQQAPVFRATTSRVRVDVVAVHDEGRFVSDLRPEEFVVLEDGQPREVISLQLVDVAEGQAPFSRQQPGGGPAPRDAPASRNTSADNVASLGQLSDLGTVVYLVDGLGLARRNQVRLSLRWLAELEAREQLSVPHALYRIDEIGQVRQIVPLTMDTAALREGVEEIARLAEVDLYRGLFIRDAQVERFALLEEFCAALAGRPGRTVLVYVSMGISLMRRGMPDTRVLAAQKAMHDAANAANVALYGVDPSLMYELVGTGVDMSRQNGTAARTRAGSGRIGAEQVNLSVEETGEYIIQVGLHDPEPR